MKAKTPTIQSADDRLGWRINEFCALVSVSRPHLWRMAKEGKLRLSYIGEVPIVPRIEAIRLGLISS